MNTTRSRGLRAWTLSAALVSALALTACGGGSTPGGQAQLTQGSAAAVTALTIREASRSLFSPTAGTDHLVSVNAAAWSTTQAGDRVDIALPGLDTLSFVVSRVNRYVEGTTSVIAQTTDGQHALNLTVGDQSAVGRLVGPQGSWQFRTENGQALLTNLSTNLSTNGWTRVGAKSNDSVTPPDPDAALIQQFKSIGLDGIPQDMIANGKALVAATDRPARDTARAAAASELSVLMVIDKAAVTAYGGQAAASTAAANLVSVANQAYVNSGVNASLKIGATYFLSTALTGTHSEILAASNNSTAPFDAVWPEQVKASADVVVVLIPFRQQDDTTGICGLASVGRFGSSGVFTGPQFPTAVVSNIKTATSSSYCDDNTLAHEVGHVLGSGHDRANEANPNFVAYTYSFGYGIDGVFGDIMSYLYPQVPMFSTPLKSTCAGRPCGIADPAPNAADAVRTFNNTAPLQAKRMAAGSALSGWYWNPAESGTGWAIEIVDGRSFVAYFHYADDGSPTWLAGNGTDCSAGGVTKQCVSFLRFTGGQTAVGTYNAPTASGVIITAEISFSNTFPATATAKLGSRTVPLQRYSFSTAPVGQRPDTRFVPLGQWHWDPAGSGTGMFIETQGDDTFIAYFNYDASGNPVWQAASGKPFSAAVNGSWNLLRLDFSEFRNGQTLQGAYKNPIVSKTQQYYGYINSLNNYVAIYDPTSSSKNRVSSNFIHYEF